VWLRVDLLSLPLAMSRFPRQQQWNREATARNYLIEGVKLLSPKPRDIILLCDVDEIVTRNAIALVRSQPPTHYYNLCGILYHYTYRWKVSSWLRPLVILYGAMRGTLEWYKFRPCLCKLPGVLHHHCSFCFPTLRQIMIKLNHFSHVEYSRGRLTNPNYVIARAVCGYSMFQISCRARNLSCDRMTLQPFDPEGLFFPPDDRLLFLKRRFGFGDLDNWTLNRDEIRQYTPADCQSDNASEELSIYHPL
jgi:hypothetical protein